MDIIEHFNAYREAVKRDSLEGYAQYASETPTKKPELFPTIADYLRLCAVNAANACKQHNDAEYMKWLTLHQEAIIKLFERMVEDEHTRLGGDDAALVNMITEKGWNWFKFCIGKVKFDNHVWVSRYVPGMEQDMFNLPVFTADEMRWCLGRKPHKTVLDAIMSEKMKGLKMFSPKDNSGNKWCLYELSKDDDIGLKPEGKFISLRDINKAPSLVLAGNNKLYALHEWTWELFP